MVNREVGIMLKEQKNQCLMTELIGSLPLRHAVKCGD